jgi:environmental stress-induced protein Ves
MTASTINVVRLADVRLQSWKNGGGVTRELLAWPTRENWQVRLSVAEIERDGPFSAFPGVMRYFAVLSGRGIDLEGIGLLHEGDVPVEFEGDEARQCKLIDGPTRDLNLMIQREAGSGCLRKINEVDGTATGQCATIHGVFDASICELRWVRGAHRLNVEPNGSRLLFYFAYWTKDVLR